MRRTSRPYSTGARAVIPEALRQALERALEATVASARSLPGGDINDAYDVELHSGEHVFVKTHPDPPLGMFSAEASGLEWLRAGELRVPRVLACRDETPAFLALEFIRPARPSRDYDERLGRGLARLHVSSPRSFGWKRDNFIGRLHQDNTSCSSWAEFYRSRRLEPQLCHAVESGRASYALRRAFDRLFERLASLFGPEEPPSRLHGDLWGGNVHIGEHGEPCLIDPAVYGGHREVDLAMMRLFGGFSERVFSAYAEVSPLADGAADRVALYQLYPLLVHANLFGGSYVASVERAVLRYV